MTMPAIGGSNDVPVTDVTQPGSMIALLKGLISTLKGTGGITSQVIALDESNQVSIGGVANNVNFGTIAVSSSGATTIQALVSSKRIRVIALALVANAAVNVKFQSHVTPTDITGLFYLAANGGIVLPYNPTGWFQTVSGEALDINLSGSIAVGGAFAYITV